MQVLRTLILLWVTSFSAVVVADSGDDTLKHYLSKSPLVVVGKISEQPLGGLVNEMVVVNYSVKISVTEVIQGAVPRKLAGTTIVVNVVRFEDSPRDQHPLLKKDSECILFLKQTSNQPYWETADVWFGIQPASPLMVKSLKRLSSEQQKSALAK